MKIILVYPAITDQGFNTSGRPIIYNQIHPGLTLLSSVLRSNGHNDIELIDLRAVSDWNGFTRIISEKKPEILGVTSMSPDFRYAKTVFELAKKVCPGVKTFIGGMHPTVRKEDCLADSNIDHIFIGEGEEVFPKVLEEIKLGNAVPRLIKGELAKDLDALPFSDRELFDCLETPYDFFLPQPFMTVLAGRGCNYACKFCSPAGKLMHGGHIRRRSVSHVINELKVMRDTYGFKSLLFWDDCFTEDPAWVKEFSDEYRKNGFKAPFVCQMRADIICDNPRMMKDLKRAGLVMASIGFESGSDRVLKFVNKGTTVKQNLKAASICKGLGVKIWAFIMFGMPTETNEEALMTVSMVKKIKPYRSSVAFFTPHPGSIFYDYCKNNNLTLIDEYEDFVKIPELDKPKIKNIDYEFMRKLAIECKKQPTSLKLIMKVEKIIAHKKNKKFKKTFQAYMEKYPGMNKMAILRKMKNEGNV